MPHIHQSVPSLPPSRLALGTVSSRFLVSVFVPSGALAVVLLQHWDLTASLTTFKASLTFFVTSQCPDPLLCPFLCFLCLLLSLAWWFLSHTPSSCWSHSYFLPWWQQALELLDLLILGSWGLQASTACSCWERSKFGCSLPHSNQPCPPLA